MKEELRKRVVGKFCLDYVHYDELMTKRDFYSLDGMNSEGTVYVALRVSSEEILGVVQTPFSQLEVNGDKGSISELRKQGHSWEELFTSTYKDISRE